MNRILSAAVLLSALSLSPLAAAQSRVYSDPFDTVGGWPDSDATGDLDAVYTVVGGEYLINPLQDRRYALAMAPAATASADQSVEADVRLAASNPDSRAGIACRVGPGLNFYAFNLISAGGYEIVRVRDGEAESLASGRLHVDPADGVRVRAECRGAALALYVDGREMAAVSDTGLPDANGAGLISVSPVIAATNAAFDNFELAEFGGGTRAVAAPRVVPASRDRAAGAGAGAARSAPVQLEDMALFNDAFGEPGERQSLFDTGHQRVYAVMEFAGRPRAHFRAEWRAVNGDDEAVLLDSEYDNSDGNGRIWLYAERNWNAGLYRVDVYADGRLLEQREFSVY